MTEKLIPASIGIDLGSWTSKIAVAKRGGVQIITNQANFRQTPSVVGFGPAQRNIGQSGNIKMKSNFRDTITAPMRFLGLTPQYPLLRAQTKYCPARSNINSGKIIFQVNYQGQKEQLVAQQVAAAYLNKLKNIIARNGFQNKQAVVAVPTYLTQRQRKAFLDAAKIAQLNITRLINDSTAIALDYGMFRKNQLQAQNARNVLFLDFGHSKLSLFTCSFTKSQMNVLHQQFARNLGCRDIDYHLYQFYRKIFEKSSSGCDIAQNRKAIVKIMQYIQKQRKILSGNSQHQMNIQYLMQQCDLQYTMTRNQFQKISQPIFHQIGNYLIKNLEILKKKNINIHSIQLVGGGSRIPRFIQIVKDIYGIQPSRTLNSSQSVARGCALMAAIKSPLFKVPDYGLHQKAYYGVKFYWNFVQGNHLLGLNSDLYPQKQGKMIFQDGARVPTSKTIKFTRKQAIQILVQYQPTIVGFSKHIGYYLTKPQHPKEDTFGVSFKLRYNQHGLITFDQCTLIEQWTEQTKVPKKKVQKKQAKKQDKKQGQGQKMDIQNQPNPPPQQQQFEIKKSKKQKFSQVKYDQNTFDTFNQKDIQNYFSLESTMMNQDKLLLQTYQRKNQLQSIIYSWRQRISGSHQQFIQPNQINNILLLLDQNSKWLYQEGQNSNRGTYINKIQGIKSKTNQIQKRYQNFQNIGYQLNCLVNTLKENFDFVNSLDKKYQHITSQQRQEVFNQIQRVKFWISNSEQQQAKKRKWQQPSITVADIRKHAKQVTDKARQVMNKPVPKPAQKPAQQPKKDQKTQKMDVETQKMETQN